jgi:hypothetical protein
MNTRGLMELVIPNVGLDLRSSLPDTFCNIRAHGRRHHTTTPILQALVTQRGSGVPE